MFPQSRFNEISVTRSAAASHNTSHPLQPPAPRQPLDNDDLDDILANADPSLLMYVDVVVLVAVSAVVDMTVIVML